MKVLTIGADPEVFLQNQNREIISAIPIIPGSKANNYTEGLKEGFGLQTDNILAEFTIAPVKAYDGLRFLQNIEYMLGEIGNFLPKNVNISIKFAARVKSEYLRSKQAKQFGCDPDFNAWTKEINPKPNIELEPKLRSAGGHIHIGLELSKEEDETEIITKWVKLLDEHLLPVIAQNEGSQGRTRRKLYGAPGAFRFKPYGFEYRPLSNIFIFSPPMIAFIMNRIRFIENNFDKLEVISKDYEGYFKNVVALEAGNRGPLHKTYVASSNIYFEIVNTIFLSSHDETAENWKRAIEL